MRERAFSVTKRTATCNEFVTHQPGKQMILSHKFKFIFVKGKKVAGTSVEMALSTICGPTDIVTPITAIDELQRLRMGGHAQNYSIDRNIEAAYTRDVQTTAVRDLSRLTVPKEQYYNHMSLRELINAYEQPLTGYAIVCIERCPYDKILSWANMVLSFKSYQEGAPMQSDLIALRRFLDQALDNDDFIDVRNIDLYRGSDNRVTARVMRYENLLADLTAFLKALDVKDLPYLPHVKKGLAKHLEPREFFRKDQLRKINDLFSEEFNTFGYDYIS
jgi:hypothetical protein